MSGVRNCTKIEWFNWHLEQKQIVKESQYLKTNNGVFVAFKTKHDLKCQFSGNIECVCFHY